MTASTKSTVDVRTIVPRDRHPLIFGIRIGRVAACCA
jgi:uncharacterized protein (DUF2249 family)